MSGWLVLSLVWNGIISHTVPFKCIGAGLELENNCQHHLEQAYLALGHSLGPESEAHLTMPVRKPH